MTWTMPTAPGFLCDDGGTSPVSGRGSQTITVTARVRAADHTATFVLGRTRKGLLWKADITLNTVDYHVIYPGFSVWQTDERQATITAGNICGQGYHLTLGSLCGTKRARPVSHSGRGPEVWLQPTPKSGAGSFQGWLVRNGRLAVGLTAFDGKLDPAGFLGAAATHSYNDPVGNGDCPLAGDEYLPFSYPDQNQTLEGANAFLLYEHDSADDLGQQVPSRAWLSLAKLVDCGVKTFSPGDSGGPTTSSGVWSGGGYEPSDPPARWSATTTLEWTMKLHRVGCKGFDGWRAPVARTLRVGRWMHQASEARTIAEVCDSGARCLVHGRRRSDGGGRWPLGAVAVRRPGRRVVERHGERGVRRGRARTED